MGWNSIFPFFCLESWTSRIKLIRCSVVQTQSSKTRLYYSKKKPQATILYEVQLESEIYI